MDARAETAATAYVDWPATLGASLASHCMISEKNKGALSKSCPQCLSPPWGPHLADLSSQKCNDLSYFWLMVQRATRGRLLLPRTWDLRGAVLGSFPAQGGQFGVDSVPMWGRFGMVWPGLGCLLGGSHRVSAKTPGSQPWTQDP